MVNKSSRLHPVILPLILIFLALIPFPVQAQENAMVQELRGEIEQGKLQVYRLPDLRGGQTLYIHTSGTSGNLDPLVGLVEGSQDIQTARATYNAEIGRLLSQGGDPLLAIEGANNQFFLTWDDDSGGGLSAAIEFTIPKDGDYWLVVGGSLSYQGDRTFGDYRLLLGLDAPQVLSGQAEPTGDIIAVLDEQATGTRIGVEELTGSLSPEKPSTFTYLLDFKSGDKLYAYIEATSGDLKPVLVLRNFARKPLRTGNLDGTDNQTSIEYTFLEDGENYQLEILTPETTSQNDFGEYRLLVGRNAPQVLSGNAPLGGDPVLRQPVEVKIGVKLQQIIDVNQQNENFNVVASLQMEWQDPGLAYNPEECQCWVKLYTEKEFDRFLADVQGRWPDFTIANQQGNRWTQNRLAVLLPDGSGTYFERFTTNLQLDFDFRQFPFDTQQFLIRVDLLLPEEYYYFSDLDGFSEISQEHGEDEFIITDFDTSISREVASTQSLTSRYTFSFTAPRHIDYYAFQIFVPVLLIIGVSWVTFFLKDYTRRIEVATGNLLLFIAFSFSIADNYPRLGYLTFLDFLMAITFIVNALVVIYNVFLKRMEMNGEAERAEQIDNYLDWTYPLTYIIPIGIVVLVLFF